MTKSIDKAQKGNVLIKGNVGDNVPSFEKVELLKINDKTYDGNNLYATNDQTFGMLQVEVTGLDPNDPELPVGTPTQNVEVVIKYESKY